MSPRCRSLPLRLGLLLVLGIAGGCDAPTAPARSQTAPAGAVASATDPASGANAPKTKPASTDPPKGPVAPSIEYAEAGGLHYVERIVGGGKPDDALPMIVAIHGLGDRPEAFGRIVESFVEPARVILPRGIEAYEGGWSWFPTRARDPDVDKLGQGITAAADVIAAGLAVLVEQRPTRGKPVVTGFSQGGMLTFALALQHPEVVGAAIPVGGWLPPPLWPSDGPGTETFPSVVALHGTADAAVRYEPTKLAVETLGGLGYDVTLHTFEGVPHAIPPPVHRDMSDLLQDAVRKAARSKPTDEAAASPEKGSP